MAFSNQNGPSSSLSEINVTPLVDVMLVLLIIFMISAPLMQSGVELQLPEGKQVVAAHENNLVLSIRADGKHYLNDEYLQPEVVIDNVKKAIAVSKNKTIYVRGDANLLYGEVMKLISHLKDAGIDEVSLVTEPIKGKR